MMMFCTDLILSICALDWFYRFSNHCLIGTKKNHVTDSIRFAKKKHYRLVRSNMSQIYLLTYKKGGFGAKKKLSHNLF